MKQSIAIIGDGAMGTLCARILGAQHRVSVWGRDPARLAETARLRENRRYLPGAALPASVVFTPEAGQALHAATLIVCAVPAQYIRPVMAALLPAIPPAVPILSVAKGIENNTLLRPTQVILEICGPRPVAALSGPSIAAELARELPATLVAAAADPRLLAAIQQLFTTRYLRVYSNVDLVGVELAGALKNVIAIAAGILDGLAVGNNAKAALLTRGLVEITRLGMAMGAAAETFAGLAGLGDLVTTCVAPEGRNRSFGERIGAGQSPEQVLPSMRGVVEGLATTRSVMALAQRYDVEMPISRCLYAVLFEGKNAQAGMYELMARDPKPESTRAM